MEEEDGKGKTNKVTLDEVLSYLGDFGRHQQFLYFLFSVIYVFTSMQLVGWVFVGAIIKHR